MRDQLRVLVVVEKPAAMTALAVLFDLHHIPNCSTRSPAEACQIAARETLGAVVMDMNFAPHLTSGEEGVELFRSLREIDPDLPIAVITAWASLEAAVELVTEGAAEYLEKPWQDDRLVAAVRNLVELRQVRQENRRLRTDFRRTREELALERDLCGIVYRSPAMHRVVSLAVSVADSSAPVLISGPSGSGKGMLAEIVHANSTRRNQPFVCVNVGAIPAELIESELHGVEAGAYTGNPVRRIGRFETANRGTIFLDGVDGLSLADQVTLLRVLQSGVFRPVGGRRTIEADVRIISATNADLVAAVGKVLFREDLYYRLNVFELRAPALADRLDDVLPLARHFLARHARGTALELAEDAERVLLAHDWPGNVRELQNRIQRAIVVATGQTIRAADFGITNLRRLLDGPPPDNTVVERNRLLEVLSYHRGKVANAAKELGISGQALFSRMVRLGIERERRRSSRPLSS